MTQGGEGKYGGDGRKADGPERNHAAGSPTRVSGARKRSGDPMRRPQAPAALDPKVQDQLGRVFRGFCDDLVNQPIPDKFSVLLARLEAKQREKE
jgi:hypothetical protein